MDPREPQLARPFVGRSREVARLAAALDGACAGRGTLVRIVGEPGIGKTRLADELAALATERAARVAWGRAWEAGGAPAFWPWTQIASALGDDAPALDGDASAPHASAEAEQARFRVFEATTKRLRRASEQTPLVVVLDDAHAADIPSLMLLRFVASGLRASKILVVVTQREVEARLQPQVGELLAKIAREGETIALARLAEDDVASWLCALGRDEKVAARLHRASEGNPLFVQELLEVTADGAVVPDAVRSVIAEHLGRVSGRARRVLELAAAFGRDASPSVLAQLDGSPADVEAAVREAITLGVLETRARDVVAFRHILLRDELYASVDATRRAELHAAIAAMFARRADSGDDDALARAAHHELEAAMLGAPIEPAIDRARQAAVRAIARVAYEQAAELLERAARLVETRAALDDARACALLVDWGESLVLSGRGPQGRDVSARAGALAKTLGERALVVRAALVYGSEILTGQRDERMIALLRDATDAVDPDDLATRARVMSRLSAALIPTKDDEREPAQLARASIAMARRAGNPRALLHTLQFALGGLVFVVDANERRALVTEIVHLAEQLDQPAVAAAAYPGMIASALDLGSVSAADQALAGLARLVARMPQPSYRIRDPIVRATRATIEARFDDADAHLAEASALAASADGPLPGFLLAFCRLGHHYTRRDVARMTADYPRMLPPFHMTVIGPLFEALYHAMRAAWGDGDREHARASVAREIPSLVTTVGFVALAATGPAAMAATLVGDVELVRMLEPFVRRHVDHHKLIWLGACAGCLGPTTLLLGDMAMLLGNRDEARRLYDDAIAFCDSIGARAYGDLARAQRDALGGAVVARTAVAPASPPTIALTSRGEMWTLVAGRDVLHLRDSKGLAYMAVLLAHPHEEIHVAQLVGANDEAIGDAGPMLDDKAKASYRRRATELREALDDATARNDTARAEAAREELDALGDELARAVGLGGRDRKAASSIERMRINVQRRIKDVIERVRAANPALGRYLDASVRTGAFCSYAPAWTGRDG